LVRYQDFSVIQAETICANLLEGAWCAAITPPAKRMSSPEPKHLPSTIVREDEGALVSLAKSGDLAAFDELVNRYERRIFRLAMNITQNREDAEDATQDAFLKSFQHLGDFQGGSRFYTWLVRIAVNEALMRLRRRRPNVTSLDEPVQTEEDLMPREIQDWGPTPEQRYQSTELNSILNSAISDLEPIFRTVFVLRDVEQLSTEETADALGISVPAVKSRLLRGRLRLREKLNRFFEQRKPA
jgi:RNA polymerase sigma-70 factor (ECF subfamily)